MNNIIVTLIKFELLQSTRSLYSVMQPAMLFAFLIILYPMTMSAEQYKTIDHLSSICIIGIFFSTLYGTTDLFHKDYADGFLEQLYLNNVSFNEIVISKILVNILFYLPPIIILLFFATKIYNIESSIWLYVTTTLLFLKVNMLVIFASTLCIKNQKNNILKALVIYPIVITLGILYNITLNKISIHDPGVLGMISVQAGVAFIIIPISIILSSIMLQDNVCRN